MRKLGEFEEIAYRIERAAEIKEEDDGEERGSLREAFRRKGGGGVVSLVLHEKSRNEQVYSFRLMSFRLHEGAFYRPKIFDSFGKNNYKLKLKFSFPPKL